MNLLYQYSKNYWKLFAAALLLATTNQVFSLLDPLIFRHVIDSYATKPHQYTQAQFVRGAGLLLLAMAGVAFVSRVAKNFQDYFVNVIVQRLGAKMYSDGIRHSLDLPYQVFEDQRSGETRQRALYIGRRHRFCDDLRLLRALVDCSRVFAHGAAARDHQFSIEQADQEDAEDHCRGNHRAGGFDNRIAAQYRIGEEFGPGSSGSWTAEWHHRQDPKAGTEEGEVLAQPELHPGNGSQCAAH
jgi:hypothetical protein